MGVRRKGSGARWSKPTTTPPTRTTNHNNLRQTTTRNNKHRAKHTHTHHNNKQPRQKWIGPNRPLPVKSFSLSPILWLPPPHLRSKNTIILLTELKQSSLVNSVHCSVFFSVLSSFLRLGTFLRHLFLNPIAPPSSSHEGSCLIPHIRPLFKTSFSILWAFFP